MAEWENRKRIFCFSLILFYYLSSLTIRFLLPHSFLQTSLLVFSSFFSTRTTFRKKGISIKITKDEWCLKQLDWFEERLNGVSQTRYGRISKVCPDCLSPSLPSPSSQSLTLAVKEKQKLTFFVLESHEIAIFSLLIQADARSLKMLF